MNLDAFRTVKLRVLKHRGPSRLIEVGDLDEPRRVPHSTSEGFEASRAEGTWDFIILKVGSRGTSMTSMMSVEPHGV